jgi:hypothetical protein
LIAGNEKEVHGKGFVAAETKVGPKGLIGGWETVENRFGRQIYDIGFGKGVSYRISFGVIPFGSDLVRKRKRKWIHGCPFQ